MVTAVVVLAGPVPAAFAHGDDRPDGPRVVAEGLDNPRQLNWDQDGNLVVVEAGRGGPDCVAERCAGPTGAVTLIEDPHRDAPAVSTVVEGLGEALALARACGVPAEEFVKVITSTSLAAPAYKNYGKLMVERAYEPAQFSLELGLKDLELALATARLNAVALPSAELVRDNLLRAIAAGDGHKDWAAVAEYVKGSG